MPENDESYFSFDFPEEPNQDEAPCLPSIEIYDAEEIRHKLAADTVDDLWSDETSRSNEEDLWRKRLKTLIQTPDLAKRSLLIADDSMLERIAALRDVTPHFGAIIDLVYRAARLSQTAQSPLLLPPLLFLGNPGIGKTFFARRLAMALGTYLETVAMDLVSDSFELTGLALSWRAARPGKIANALIASKTASPIFFLDEVDKVNAVHSYDRPLNFLHSVLEPENAARFMDDYYTFAMRADHAIWILTANSIDGLAPSIIDRLMVARIDDPTQEQLTVVVTGIYVRVNQRYNSVLAERPSEGVIDQLLEMNPRNIRKVLELAFGFAHAGKAQQLSVEDVKKASRLLGGEAASKGTFGFL